MARKKYNKKVKRKHANSYVAKPVNPPSKEKKGYWGIIKNYIRKPPNYAIIVSGVGVLSALITIYQFWISPEDKVRNKIESHVSVIRETFNRIDIKEKDKSNQEVEMIKDFQQTAISFINYWKAVEAIKPIEESRGFEDADAYFRNIYLEREMESQINKYRMLYYSFHEVKDKIVAIILYGQKHDIYEYVYSSDRWNNISKDFEIIERIAEDTKEQVKNRRKKIEYKRGSLDNLPAEELSYTMEPYYKMFGTMETLVLLEEFMSFIIDFNASNMYHLEKEMQSQ